ncbi:MAG: OsmC family protein [Gammaproteobacteria bacterium]|nr:OsmC family protein [Gammaproteobacteria bacterium]
MELKVRLDGAKCVSTHIGSHEIRTDQPVKAGGGDTAPAPYDLFLASIATCAGFFVQSYCENKQIDTTGIGITLNVQRDPASKRVTTFVITIEVPPHLPEHLQQTLCRVAAQCAVTKTIESQPEFVVQAKALGD